MRRNEPTRIFPRPYFNPQIAEHNSPATRAPRPSAAPHPSCTTLRNCGFLIFNPPRCYILFNKKKGNILYRNNLGQVNLIFFLIFWMVIFTRNSLLFFLVHTLYYCICIRFFLPTLATYRHTHKSPFEKKKHGFTSCSRYNCMYNNSSLDKYVQVHCIIVHFLYSIK